MMTSYESCARSFKQLGTIPPIATANKNHLKGGNDPQMAGNIT
jgi:hypothetical protein